jgi:hypothetical protein
MTPNLEYDNQLQKFINDIIIYYMKQWNFSAFSLSAFKFGVQSFDVQYLSVFGHLGFGHSGSLFGVGSNSVLFEGK